MKKITLLVNGFLLLALVSNAQVKLGVKGGMNLAKWNIKVNGTKEEDYKNKLGLQAGFVADFSLGKSLSFQPQLLYTAKGTAEEHNGHDDKIVMNAIDLPLNLLYKAPAKFGTFFVGGGPNIGYNLGGKVKSHDAGEEGKKITIGSADDQIKALDFGVNFTSGIEFKNGLFFSANYTTGLSNLSNRNGETTKSNFIGISLGYFLKHK